MPFIKSEAAKHLHGPCPDSDDAISIAMFAFYEAILAYRSGRGSFLKLAATAIRHRLIDYRRKQARHQGHLSLDAPIADEEHSIGQQLPDRQADLEHHQDRWQAQLEIGHFVLQLSEFGLTLADIAENCPKQKRTMSACMQALTYARENPALLQQLLSTKKLPISPLAAGAQVDRKALERHRKYVIAILLAYTNGFEILRGHLQGIKGKEVAVL